MARVARITPPLLHRNRSCSHRLPDRSWSRLPALGGAVRSLANTVGRSARLTREVLAAWRAGEQAGERAQTLAESGRPAGSKQWRSVAAPPFNGRSPRCRGFGSAPVCVPGSDLDRDRAAGLQVPLAVAHLALPRSNISRHWQQRSRAWTSFSRVRRRFPDSRSRGQRLIDVGGGTVASIVARGQRSGQDRDGPAQRG